MSKSATNFAGLKPEIGDEYYSASNSIIDSMDGIDGKIGTVNQNIENLNSRVLSLSNDVNLASGNINNYKSQSNNIFLGMEPINTKIEEISPQVDDMVIDVQALKDAILISTSNETLYRVNRGSIAGIKVDMEPRALKYDPINKHLYVVSNSFISLKSTLTIINTVSNIAFKNIILDDTADIGEPNIEYDPVNHRMFISGESKLILYVIDCGVIPVLNTIISLEANPRGMEYDPINQNIWVCTSGGIKIINCTSLTITDTIIVSQYIRKIAYDPINGKMYIAKYVTPYQSQGYIYSYNCSTKTLVATITLPNLDNPISMIFNTVNNNIYVFIVKEDTSNNLRACEINCLTDTYAIVGNDNLFSTSISLHAYTRYNCIFNDTDNKIYLCDYYEHGVGTFECFSYLESFIPTFVPVIGSFDITMNENKEVYVTDAISNKVFML